RRTYWRTIAASLAAVLSMLSAGIVRAEPPGSPVKSGAASCARPDFRVVLECPLSVHHGQRHCY
ncbi:MAG: hypothetical protein WCB62_26455, partial [Pseudolabrys sp.]